MCIRVCDSCGGPLTTDTGGDVFFVVRLAITKGTAWSPVERAAAARLSQHLDVRGFPRLARELDRIEPVEIVGDAVPKLVTHADLRVCAGCIQERAARPGSGINLLDLIHAAEFKAAGVSPSQTT